MDAKSAKMLKMMFLKQLFAAFDAVGFGVCWGVGAGRWFGHPLGQKPYNLNGLSTR